MQKLLFTWNFIIVQIPLKSSRLLPDISLLTTDLLNRPYITVCMLLSAIQSEWNPRSRDQILFSVVSPGPSTVPGTQHILTTGLVGALKWRGRLKGFLKTGRVEKICLPCSFFLPLNNFSLRESVLSCVLNWWTALEWLPQGVSASQRIMNWKEFSAKEKDLWTRI